MHEEEVGRKGKGEDREERGEGEKVEERERLSNVAVTCGCALHTFTGWFFV